MSFRRQAWNPNPCGDMMRLVRKDDAGRHRQAHRGQHHGHHGGFPRQSADRGSNRLRSKKLAILLRYTVPDSCPENRSGYVPINSDFLADFSRNELLQLCQDTSRFQLVQVGSGGFVRATYKTRPFVDLNLGHQHAEEFWRRATNTNSFQHADNFQSTNNFQNTNNSQNTSRVGMEVIATSTAGVLPSPSDSVWSPPKNGVSYFGGAPTGPPAQHADNSGFYSSFNNQSQAGPQLHSGGVVQLPDNKLQGAAGAHTTREQSSISIGHPPVPLPPAHRQRVISSWQPTNPIVRPTTVPFYAKPKSFPAQPPRISSHAATQAAMRARNMSVMTTRARPDINSVNHYSVGQNNPCFSGAQNEERPNDRDFQFAVETPDGSGNNPFTRQPLGFLAENSKAYEIQDGDTRTPSPIGADKYVLGGDLHE